MAVQATQILSASRAKRLAAQTAAPPDLADKAARLANYYGSQLWRLPRVCEQVGLSGSMIYLLIKRGEFPKPVPLTGRTKAWLASDIIEWVEARISAAKAGAQ